MFWLLIVILFHTDGSKEAAVLIEPTGTTEAQCASDANKWATEFSKHPLPGVLDAGLKCDGPLDDPAVPRSGA